MTKTVTLTLEQAEIALYLNRAELAQRLNTAINNAMKDN